MTSDDVAANGNEVELGTEKEQMTASASMTVHGFELVDDVPRFVFEVAVIFVVLWVFPQFAEQFIVADFVDHGVTHRFDFEVAAAQRDEVEAHQKGFPAFVHFDRVRNEAVAAVLRLPRGVTDFAHLQNADFEEGIAPFDDFVGSVNLFFHFVGDVEDRTFEEFPEEGESAEEIEVALAVDFPAESRGKVRDEAVLLLNVELLLHLCRFVDVVLHLLHQYLRKSVVLCQMVENLSILINKLAIKSNFTDNLTKTADII